MSNIINYQGESFINIIDQKKLILFDFFATWCPPCRNLLSVLEEVYLLEKDILLYKINVDLFKSLAIEQKVRNLPTIILYKDKKELARQTGFLDKQQLLKFLHLYK